MPTKIPFSKCKNINISTQWKPEGSQTRVNPQSLRRVKRAKITPEPEFLFSPTASNNVGSKHRRRLGYLWSRNRWIQNEENFVFLFYRSCNGKFAPRVRISFSRWRWPCPSSACFNVLAELRGNFSGKFYLRFHRHHRSEHLQQRRKAAQRKILSTIEYRAWGSPKIVAQLSSGGQQLKSV